MSQRNPNSLDLICVHIEDARLPIEAYIVLRKPIADFDSGKSYMCYLCRQSFEQIMNKMDIEKFAIGHIEDYIFKIRNYE